MIDDDFLNKIINQLIINQPVYPIQMTKIKLTLLLSVLFFFQNTKAQQEMGLHSMTNVWNSNTTNPAFMPDYKFVVGLPSVRDNLYLTGPTFGDFIVEQDGKNFIDFNQAIAQMEEENLIRNDFSIQTLSFAFRIKNLMLSLGHSGKAFTYAKYNRALPQVVYQGNAQFVGETVDLSNEFVLNSYNEFALGAAYKIGKITIGAKAKYLSGFRSAATDKDQNSATLFTDPDIYQLTLTSDYRLNSSGTVDFNGFDEFDIRFDVNDAGDEIFTDNTGWAFDLGATMEVTEKLTIAASVLDIGSIEWTEDTRNYTSSGTFVYEGLDISDAITNGDDDPDFGNPLDTIEAIFRATETNDSYTVDLPTKFYLSGQYQISEKLGVGAAFFTGKFRDETFTSLSLNGRYQLLKNLTVGANYSTLLEEGKQFNLGLNAAIKVGPVQVFGTTDNVVSLFNQEDAQFFSARFGVNLLFGKIEANN